MEWVADLNMHGHYGGSSSAGSVWVLLYTMYKGFGIIVIETGMTKVMAVRVEEMTPLREELDSSEDWEEESCAV